MQKPLTTLKMALRKLVTLVLVTYVLRRRKFKKLRVLLTTFQVRSQPVVLSFLLLPPPLTPALARQLQQCSCEPF